MAYLGHIFPRLPTPFAHSNGVVIRTNGGTLTINAPQDEVAHYGKADYVDIIAVKPSSYEENGTVSLVKVTKGNVALTSDANVEQIHLAKTGNEFTVKTRFFFTRENKIR